jgi:predicted ArsR family transcriptional regulator
MNPLELLAYLTHGAASGQDIADRFGIKLTAARRFARRLVEEGLIYEVTPKQGREWGHPKGYFSMTIEQRAVAREMVAK